MITGEIVSGAGTSWTLDFSPAAGSLVLYASGVRLTPGVGNGYSNNGKVITTFASYAAGTLTADYDLLPGSYTEIRNEVAAGSGTAWTLAQTPIPNSVAVSGSGVRLTPGVGNDYSINGGSITTVASYAAGSVLVDYLVLTSTNVVWSITDQLTPYALTTLQRVKDLLFDPNLTFTLSGAVVTQGSATVTGTVQSGKIPRVGQLIQGSGIPNGTTIAAIITASQIVLSQSATSSYSGQTLYVVDQTTAFDAVLVRLINYATNYISNECGRPSFVQQTYVNDTYSIDTSRQDTLVLRNTPVFPAGDGIHLTSFQWRAGTPSNPSWTDFIPDQYELINPRTDPVSGLIWYPAGMVKVYGVLPRIYSNMIRASYTAGYPVNWANPEDHNTHWLPGDLTSVCENLVIRRFHRRQLAGKSSDRIGEASITWRNTLDQEDKDVIGQYQDLHF
jgi:hypothetical protein